MLCEYVEVVPLVCRTAGIVDKHVQGCSRALVGPVCNAVMVRIERAAETVNRGAFRRTRALVVFVKDSVAVLVYTATVNIYCDAFGRFCTVVFCVGHTVIV